MRSALAASSIAIPLTFGTAHAQTRIDVLAGPSFMDGYSAAAVFLDATRPAHDIGASSFTWAPMFSLGWINDRNVERYDGDRYDTHDTVVLGAGGLQFRYGDPASAWRHWFVSEQLAVQSGRTRALSTPYEFISTLGWQGDRFTFALRHVSNGGLHKPNRGESMVLVGVGF